MGKTGRKILGIDPGLCGAFAITDGNGFVETYAMPVKAAGRDKWVDFDGVTRLLADIKAAHGVMPAFLEKAVSFGMGTKGAFNYGRGFEAVVIALHLAEISVTQVEPNKWTKEMHEGTNADLRPKLRSAVAVERLFPKLVRSLPRTRPKGGQPGKLLDGPVDAFLIAAYGLRRLSPVSAPRPEFTQIPGLPRDAGLFMEKTELKQFRDLVRQKDGDAVLDLLRQVIRRLRTVAFDRGNPVDPVRSDALLAFANELLEGVRPLEDALIGEFL